MIHTQCMTLQVWCESTSYFKKQLVSSAYLGSKCYHRFLNMRIASVAWGLPCDHLSQGGFERMRIWVNRADPNDRCNHPVPASTCMDLMDAIKTVRGCYTNSSNGRTLCVLPPRWYKWRGQMSKRTHMGLEPKRFMVSRCVVNSA